MQQGHLSHEHCCPPPVGVQKGALSHGRSQGTWSLKTVRPSLSVSWNQSRHVTRLPVQLWKLQKASPSQLAFDYAPHGTALSTEEQTCCGDSGYTRRKCKFCIWSGFALFVANNALNALVVHVRCCLW